MAASGSRVPRTAVGVLGGTRLAPHPLDLTELQHLSLQLWSSSRSRRALRTAFPSPSLLKYA